MLRGEVAALTAAFLWALSTVIFGRLGKSLSPLVLNLAKGGIAIALILITLVLQQNLQPQLPSAAIFWLMLSGVIGIGLGDTAYFRSINYLGARRALLMECLAPPLTALIALVFLQEQLSAIAWGGILLTVGGIAWVISERVPTADQKYVNLRAGILWSVLAQLGQASGAVMSRGVLANTDIDPLWSGLLRIAAGGIILVILVGSRGQVGQNCDLCDRGKSYRCWCWRPFWVPIWRFGCSKWRSNLPRRALLRHCWRPVRYLCCPLR